MKFPTATIILVSAAVIFVVWDQYREKPQPVDAQRFGNLAANPVERGVVMDWVTAQVPQLCVEATGKPEGSDEVSACIDRSEEYQPTCRRLSYDRFPSLVASDKVFREMSTTMMACLVRESRPL